MSKIETNVIKPQIEFSENSVKYILITKKSENKLDDKIKEIENLIENNTGKGKSEEEKDSLYQKGQTVWKEYSDLLQDTKYNFCLSQKQLKFLSDLVLNHLEYDVNTVFIAIELINLMTSMKDSDTNVDTLNVFPANATEITYIYHLISTHKVKGLTEDAVTFSEILRKIGDVSKIFNYYEALGKSLATDVQDWIACLEDGVSKEPVLQSN